MRKLRLFLWIFFKEADIMVSQKTRFDVFKRDDFTCQYCGRKSPEVILEVDHITPRSEGGNDDMGNLITSCRECNHGKYTTEIIPKYSDDAYKIELHKLDTVFDKWKRRDTVITKQIKELQSKLRRLYTRHYDLSAKLLETELDIMNLNMDHLTEENLTTSQYYNGGSLEDLQLDLIEQINEKQKLKQEASDRNYIELKLLLYKDAGEKELWINSDF